MLDNSLRMFIVSLLFLLTCCSTNKNTEISKTPTGVEQLLSLETDFIPDKVCYSYIDSTIYLLEKNKKKFHIYRLNKHINTIGGFGFGSQKFQDLSDCCLSVDGNLLTLDRFQKKIKKFDLYGKFISEIKLLVSEDPTLIDINSNGRIYIYDSSKKAIISFRDWDQENKTTFGQFQFTEPDLITTNSNKILIYDKYDNISLEFNEYGIIENEFKGFVQKEFNNIFTLLNPFLIYEKKSDTKLLNTMEKIQKYRIKDKFLTVIFNNKIEIYKILYD